MKKNGFISMSLIYTFFLLFLSLMTFLVVSYRRESHLIKEYNQRIKESFIESDSTDERLKIYLINNGVKAEINYLPEDNYTITHKYCDKGKITYNTLTKKFYITDRFAKCEVIYEEILKGGNNEN